MDIRDIRLINGWHVTLFGHTWIIVLMGVLLIALLALLGRMFVHG
jgi:hypothetical protein